MNITVDVDARQLQKAFAKAPVLVGQKLQGWVTHTAAMAEREAKTEHLDHVDQGRLQSSIRITPGLLKAEVKPTAKYAEYVISGRRPGSRMPPFGDRSSLGSRARRKGIEPFVVARSIARKGIKADPFMEETYRSIKPKAERNGNKVLDEIVRNI